MEALKGDERKRLFDINTRTEIESVRQSYRVSNTL